MLHGLRAAVGNRARASLAGRTARISVMRSCSSAATCGQLLGDSVRRRPAGRPAIVSAVFGHGAPRGAPGRPQLCAMSVALDAQGDTVPRRGVTTMAPPSAPGRCGVAVGQQRGQALMARAWAGHPVPPGARSAPQWRQSSADGPDAAGVAGRGRAEALPPAIVVECRSRAAWGGVGEPQGAWAGGGPEPRFYRARTGGDPARHRPMG